MAPPYVSQVRGTCVVRNELPPVTPFAPSTSPMPSPGVLTRLLARSSIASLLLPAKLNGASRVLLSTNPLAQVPRGRARGSGVVRASVSVLDEAERELQRKSMAELRALAKARGLRGDTKAELVEQLLLSGAASLAYSAPAQPPAPPAVVPGGADAMTQLLEKMPLPQLRELARERGSRSSTRADILRDLRLIMAGQPLPKPPPRPAPVIPPPSPSPAPPASPPAAAKGVSAPARPPPAASAGAGGGAGAREKELLGLGLAELRQMARAQGVRGDTKAQIVAALLSVPGAHMRAPRPPHAPPALRRAQQAATPVKAKPPSPQPAAPAVAASPAPAAAKPAPKPAAPKPAAAKPAAGGGAAKGAAEKAAGEKGEVELALEAMDMGELRYLARERGLKGDTKDELVKALAEGPPPTLGFIGLPPPSAPRRRRMPKFRAPPKDVPASAAAAAAGAEQAEGEQEKAQAEEVAAAGEEAAREAEVAGAEALLPPFQSTAAPDSPSPAPLLPVTPGEMAGEVARLREAVAGMRGEVEEEARRVKGENEEERSSKYVRTAVIGGVGLALLPLLLPALISAVRQPAPPPQVRLPLRYAPPSAHGMGNMGEDPGADGSAARVELASETAVLLQSLLAAESSSLAELKALVPLIAPDLDDATRADRAAMFCQAVPPASRSPQAERFCNAVSTVRGGQ
ncbi:unnamed protein product [Closterium sp. Naga37s-1]|nr:unnamed protein product [Closterium sp. Naga37s-1]